MKRGKEEHLTGERRKFVERELFFCERAWAEGVKEAVSDAVSLCSEFHCPPPLWLAKAATELVGGKGLTQAKRSSDLRHYVRWDAVSELRDRKGERGIPKSWEDCYALVSEVLKGTKFAGSPDTIKASYQLVQRNMRSGRGRRYYLGHKKLG